VKQSVRLILAWPPSTLDTRYETAAMEVDEDQPSLSICMLGAGQEVGRSCCVIKHRGKTVVCDVGLHPANNGISALPFIDEVDWSTVDAILITQ
jgi:cleavage and polyadenylation specificity factor subunit 3